MRAQPVMLDSVPTTMVWLALRADNREPILLGDDCHHGAGMRLFKGLGAEIESRTDHDADRVAASWIRKIVEI